MLKTRNGELIEGGSTRVRRIIRRPQLAGLTGYSIAMIYVLIARGEFPKPIPLGRRAVGWLEDEIADWQTRRVAERDEKSDVSACP